MKTNILTAQQFIQGNDSIGVFKETVNKHCSIHSHEFIEIAYVISGNGTHRVCETSASIAPGDLILLNAHVVHEFYALSDKPLVVYNCIFLPHVLDQSLKEGQNFVNMAYQFLFHPITVDENKEKKYLWLKNSNHRELDSLLESMHNEYNKKEAGYCQILKADLIRLLILCFRLYKQQPVQQIPYTKLITEHVIEYLNGHYNEPIHREDIASQFYLSASYLDKIFKENTGSTINKMLQDIRMNNAARLLSASNLPIEQLSKDVGYSDTKYFYSLFHSYFGSSPGKYRKSNRMK